MNKPQERYNFIIDFDSTFVTVEVLDELARVALSDDPDQKKKVEEIEKITRLGMDGEMAFDESLRKRLSVLCARKEHVEKMKETIRKKVSPSFLKNKSFFEKNGEMIYIISGGFKEIIIPTAQDFGIDESHVFANEFIFDEKGKIIGVDKNNFLSQENGKVKQIEALSLSEKTYIVGDGFTDYQIKAAGLAEKFVAFCENVFRPKVAERADLIVYSWDEFLEKEKI